MIKNDFLTPRQISPMYQVNFKTVLSWIRQHKLKAHQLPGGMNRVLVKDLIKFTIDHDMPMPPEIDPAGSTLGAIVVDYFFEKQMKDGEYLEPKTEAEKRMRDFLVEEGYIQEQ